MKAVRCCVIFLQLLSAGAAEATSMQFYVGQEFDEYFFNDPYLPTFKYGLVAGSGVGIATLDLVDPANEVGVLTIELTSDVATTVTNVRITSQTVIEGWWWNGGYFYPNFGPSVPLHSSMVTSCVDLGGWYNGCDFYSGQTSWITDIQGSLLLTSWDSGHLTISENDFTSHSQKARLYFYSIPPEEALAAVPLPATAWLLGSTLIGLAGARMRRQALK